MVPRLVTLMADEKAGSETRYAAAGCLAELSRTPDGLRELAPGAAAASRVRLSTVMYVYESLMSLNYHGRHACR